MFFNPNAMAGGNRFDLFKNVSQLDVIVGLLISGIFLYFIFYFLFGNSFSIENRRNLFYLSASGYSSTSSYDIPNKTAYS